MADFLDDFEWHRDSLGYRLVTEPIPWKGLPLGLLGKVEYDFNSVSKRTLVVRGNGGELIPYRPLKEFDTLYGVFAGLRNSDGVLDFIEKFGPLTNHGKLADVGEVVSHVLEQARMFNDWLKRKKSQQLAAWISAGVKQINPRLTASLVVDPPGVVRVRLLPSDLLEGLWLQLALKLRGTETIRACEHCGNWFEVGVGTGRRSDAKFCSDEHRIECNSRKRRTPLAKKTEETLKGHIRERSPGHWAVILDVRDPETGKRKRRWHSFKGTKRAAQIECARLIADLSGGGYVEPARTTLAEFLERWLEHVKTQVSPRSHERYCELARKNIVPLLGTTALSKLQPAAISSAYAKALAGGQRKRPGGLAPRTVHHMHRILRQALQQAVRWQILVRNPADLVKPPRVERAKSTTLSAEQAAQLLGALAHSRVYWPTLVALATGMRRGEVLALRWQHVDLERGVLEVVETIEETKTSLRFKPPKNGKTRAITLPAFAVAELRRLKLEQAQELLRLGIRQTGATLVCGRADGEVHKPLALTYEFARFVRQLKDLPQVRFHDLRHSHATQLLASGVHPKIAQERLGHSSVGITLDLYSHAVESLQDEAASRVDAALGRALDKQRETKG